MKQMNCLNLEWTTMRDKKYNILVTGANGQLGSEIRELSTNYLHNFFFTDKAELDIVSLDEVKRFVKTNLVDVIINCAAYTAVDQAQSDEANADAINHLAVKNLALISKELGVKLVHISTDYVFDGKNYKPYKEQDCTNPQSVYGKTKLDGERAMLKINPLNSIIIRTSWVYSSYGSNFVKTMLRLAKERDRLNVIYDQVGTPTYAKDLAKAILTIIQHSKFNIQNSSSHTEIYNFSNEGVASWYDFAKETMKMAKLNCQIEPIESKDYPTPASRPHYSILNKSKIKSEFDLKIPYWKDSLCDCITKIMNDEC